MLSSEEAVKVNNLTKIYKLYSNPTDRFKEAVIPFGKSRHTDFYALKNVSFSINKGETVGIIGKNGSGKSTLLKIITGVLSLSSGEVLVNGKISALLELGAGFNPDFTGRENIYMNGIITGFTKDDVDKKIGDIISFADIGEFIDQPVRNYSSGMFARLAFAVAINVDPDILIIDEALSVGDMAFQLKCFKKFNDFKERNKTIIFVSHDLSSIMRICDRVILFSCGELVYYGETRVAIDRYKEILADIKSDAVVEVMESNSDEVLDTHVYHTSMNNNPGKLVYGNYHAEIIDYCIFNEKREPISIIMNDELVEIMMKVKFNVTIDEPIFAFTVKDLQGNDICGTNTLYEFVNTYCYDAGDIAIIRFNQKLTLQKGKYVISFGCTKFVNEKLEVFHRLYDVCFVEILSKKNTVGYYDVNSSISVQPINFVNNILMVAK